MPNIAQLLKTEISRLARREIRAQITPLQRQVSELRQTVNQQKKRLSQLEKDLNRSRRQLAAAKGADAPAKEPAVRLSPASIKRLRQRLKLSQKDMGRLLGVSINTIVQWEAGRSKPRQRYKDGIAELRRIGIREAKKRLAEGD